MRTPPALPPHAATALRRSPALGAVQRSAQTSLSNRFAEAIGEGIKGEHKTVFLNDVRAKEFRIPVGQILFHGTTKKPFTQLNEGQIYLSDYDTATRNGETIMILETAERLALLDLSDEDTVRGLLLTQNDATLHEHLFTTTGLSMQDGAITGKFRKGTVGKSDNFLCDWTKDGADCDGFARFPVNGKGFPEFAVHAVDKLRVLGYAKMGTVTAY